MRLREGHGESFEGWEKRVERCSSDGGKGTMGDNDDDDGDDADCGGMARGMNDLWLDRPLMRIQKLSQLLSLV